MTPTLTPIGTSDDVRQNVDGWDDRLTRLSNRLTRYWYASGRIEKDGELASLRLVEVRMGDVIFAAMSIGHCRSRIRQAELFIRSAGSPIKVIRTLASTPDAPERDRIASTWEKAHERFREAYSDFHSMLWWGRSLLSRIEDTWGKKSDVMSVGLAFYLPHAAAEQVLQLRNGLRTGAFAEVKDLADYSLHAFVLPHWQIPTEFNDSEPVLLLPDQLSGPPQIAQEFTYAEKRDVARYAASIWSATREFVDQILVVLEAAQLSREDALPPERHSLVVALRENLLPPSRLA